MFRPDGTEDKKIPLDYMPNLSNVASATECTGLIFNPPLDEAEQESYQELSDMEIPPEKNLKQGKSRQGAKKGKRK